VEKLKAIWVKRALLAGLGLAIVAGLVVALAPQPVPVDTAKVTRARLSVTVDEEGKTRIRNVYVVAAPISGKVLRSPLHVGDAVAKDETIVAVIQPAAPPFLDVRSSTVLAAQVKACEANVGLAEAELRQARAELEFAESEHERAATLVKKAVAPERVLEKARLDLELRRAAVVRAEAGISLRKRELESAKARLLGPEEPPMREATESACWFEVKSPESGRVLKLVAESEQPLEIGAPLIEIGDPGDLEIVVELLSADAVKVRAGAAATVEGWGGPPLRARVDRVEPSGFTKVSALGIEEQRVKTILALEGSPAQWARLGHDFRVFVRIDVFEAAAALQVPLGALFRRGNEWHVFVFDEGRARARRVDIGERNSSVGEVLTGLEENERIVLHPSDRIADGVRVTERSTE